MDPESWASSQAKGPTKEQELIIYLHKLQMMIEVLDEFIEKTEKRIFGFHEKSQKESMKDVLFHKEKLDYAYDTKKAFQGLQMFKNNRDEYANELKSHLSKENLI